MRKAGTLIIILALSSFFALGQDDVVIKTNGDTIHAKVLEVGLNAISFKKSNNPEGPTFVETKEDIRLIIYKNGDKQFFAQQQASTLPAPILNNSQQVNSVNNNANTTDASQNNSNATSSAAAQPPRVKIEMLRDGYTIDGQKASKKDVDWQLSRSKNPAVLMPLKAAKMTSTFQKIVKITSIPTTATGGFMSLWKGIDMYNDIRRQRTTPQSYTNALISALTTAALPITNKILKNKSDKMYSKIIDMYNVTN